MTVSATLTWREALIRHVSALTFIREYSGANRGEGVEEMQRSTGNAPPAYWCMSFVYRAVRKMLGKLLLRSASCDEQRDYARKRGALRTRAQFDETIRTKGVEAVLGWIFLCVKLSVPGGDAHHTGFVGWVQPDDTLIGAFADTSFVSTEGNAADPEKPASRDGNGAYGGRLRGNRQPKTFRGRAYGVDPTNYEFIDPEAL